MGNKEIKNPILAELDDDILDNVSGGTTTAASQETPNQDVVDSGLLGMDVPS